MQQIAFIPIDNRPVCYTLPQQIAAMDKNIHLYLPDRNLLGDLTKQADIDGILNWLENLHEVDKVIVSLDTIAYGGLVPSRRCSDTFEQIVKRIEKFKNILNKKHSEVYAFSSIMRISNNNCNEEEKEYWNLYGKKIFKYSFDYHKNGFANTDVPSDILDDYLKTRNRNFDINKLYIKWSEEHFFNTLVFSKDDCAEFGLNVTEAKVLNVNILAHKLNALIKTGADEIPLTLLARAVSENKHIKIAPVFTQKDYINNISRYEDVSVYESVKGQIELAGCEICDTPDDADIVMLVNNFKDEQGELVMGVDVEGFDGKIEIPQKPYLIVDILNANGADNAFVKQFLDNKIDWDNFLGYAGWNTTGNSLGSALCCAIVKYLAQNPDINAFKKVQTVRFLDDWAYQANVRKILKSHLKEINIEELENEMKPYEGFLKEKFDVQFSRVNYSYPWNRFFEIEADLL